MGGYPMMFYIAEENKEILKKVDNRSELINSLLTKHFLNGLKEEETIALLSPKYAQLQKEIKEFEDKKNAFENRIKQEKELEAAEKAEKLANREIEVKISNFCMDIKERPEWKEFLEIKEKKDISLREFARYKLGFETKYEAN